MKSPGKYSTALYYFTQVVVNDFISCTFGIKSSIHALRRPLSGLVAAPAKKASLLGLRFAVYAPQSRYKSLAFSIVVLMCLLPELDTYGGID